MDPARTLAYMHARWPMKQSGPSQRQVEENAATTDDLDTVAVKTENQEQSKNLHLALLNH